MQPPAEDPFSIFGNVKDLSFSKKILANIKEIAKPLPKITIMHVCGTHEYVIAKNGLRDLLPDNLRVITGPGCPVCVCPGSDVEAAIALSQKKDVILTTFGDMMRVPAGKHSLYSSKGQGADVRVVYGPNDAVEIAQKNPDKEVVFFSIGFETTAPLPAFEIANRPPENFSIICAHKLVPPAMDLLLNLKEAHLQGFLLPGHVCSIIGTDPFVPYAAKYNSPMVVGGFEVNDVLISLYYLLRQIANGEGKVENTYSRIVKPQGNLKAQEYLDTVFEPSDSMWRGIGVIPGAGYALKKEFQQYDALRKFDIEITPDFEMPHGCACDQVLIGKISPHECPLFGKTCNPQHPVGPCMVSHEGACKIALMFQKLQSPEPQKQ